MLPLVLTLPLAAACDAPEAEPVNAPSSPASGVERSPSTAPSAPPASSSASEAPTGPKLVTDPAEKVLVPVMSGMGAGETPSFAIDAGLFTVRVACSGGGTAKLIVDGDEHAVTCDGSTSRIHTATESRHAKAKMTATAAQKWSLAVVVSRSVKFQSSKPA